MIKSKIFNINLDLIRLSSFSISGHKSKIQIEVLALLNLEIINPIKPTNTSRGANTKKLYHIL